MTRPANDSRRIIRDVPLLARLDDADVDALARCGHEREFRDGDVIVQEGDTDRSLHVILRGQARIAVLSSDGDEAVVARIGPGDCVGEMALFDGRPRSASVIAEGATRTFIVSHEEFVDWLSTRPQAALALLETLTLRLRRTDESLTDFFFLDVPHRLAKLLGGRVSAPGETIRMTQSQIAADLGVTRESVNKALNQFKGVGWIRLGRGRIVVDDIDALVEYSQTTY